MTTEQTVSAPADSAAAKAGEQASADQVRAATETGTKHAGAGEAATAGR